MTSFDFDSCQSPPRKFWRSHSSPVQRFRTVQVLRLCCNNGFVLSKSFQDLKKLESQGFDRTLLAKNLAQAERWPSEARIRRDGKNVNISPRGIPPPVLQVRFLQHGHTSRVCFQNLPGVVLTDWTCHEDPHPGNLAVDDKYPGGRLIFYDFGQAPPVKAQGLGGQCRV